MIWRPHIVFRDYDPLGYADPHVASVFWLHCQVTSWASSPWRAAVVAAWGCFWMSLLGAERSRWSR